ncbi:MAG: hypothetical protein ACUVRV_06655 [Cyanobacteriota bacterium]
MRPIPSAKRRYELASWLFLVGSSLFAVRELMNLGTDLTDLNLTDLKVIQTLLGVVASLLFTVGSGLFVLDARQR